ncbi:MAG: serine/threonine-protein kinase [Gemmatimonadota bacterium]
MSDLDAQLRAALGTEFTLDRELGGGGMSRVFLAREVALDRLVVVKVHPYEMRGLATDRFRREIQTVAQLQHPNIVPVLTAGESDGLLYFVMPYVEGESLRVLLERERPLSVHQARAILHDVTRALAYAHSRGIVHRDIKPDNILLTGDAAMVSDFGVAKAISSAKSNPDSMLTAVGTSLGTPSYIAPEQAAGDANVDHRADLYALGVVAYEMLAGEPPFGNRSAQQLIVAHVVEAPPPLDRRRPDLPPWLTDRDAVSRERPRQPAGGRARAADGARRRGRPSGGSAATQVPAKTVGLGRRGPGRGDRGWGRCPGEAPAHARRSVGPDHVARGAPDSGDRRRRRLLRGRDDRRADLGVRQDSGTPGRFPDLGLRLQDQARR